MHNSLKRLFAILLVALFVTGSALPLVWCISGLDHAAVEFKVGGSAYHPAVPHDEKARDFSVLANSKLAQSIGHCFDLQLIPTEAVVSQSDQAFTPATDDTPKKKPDQALGQNQFAAVACEGLLGAPPPFKLSFSQLVHLRTVILQI